MSSQTTNPVPKKKLYFDFAMSATATRAIIPLTQFRAGLTCGDRFGGVLERLEGMTASQPGKRAREVSAWAVPVGNGTVGALATVGAAAALYVDFIGATSGNGTGGITRLPFLTVGGATVFQKAGQSAVFSSTVGTIRDMAVRIRRPAATTGVTIHGVLYVQRQHSMEI